MITRVCVVETSFCIPKIYLQCIWPWAGLSVHFHGRIPIRIFG